MNFNLANRKVTSPPITLKTKADLRNFLSEAAQVVKRLPASNPIPVYPVYFGEEALEEILDKNKINRNVVANEAGANLAKMASGTWEDFSPDHIVFDKNLTIRNGQHRTLAALLYLRLSKKMVGFNVEVGASDSRVSRSVDQGRSRTPADHLRLLGVPDAEASASIRIALFAPQINEFKLDGPQTYAAYQVFKEAHDYVTSEIIKHNGPTKLRRASIIGALVRGYYYVERAKLERFIALLCSKSGDVSAENEYETSVLRFRDTVLAGRMGSGASRRGLYNDTTAALSRFERSVNASRQKSVKRDIYPLTQEAAKLIVTLRDDILNSRSVVRSTLTQRYKEGKATAAKRG